MQKASPLPGIQHRTQATPVSSCELVPVAPPSFHQWRCQAGQYATPFIDAARNQGEAADQWLEKNLQLSDVKLQRPGEIMNNFKTGQLLSRKVDVDGEIKYQQGRLIPRPGTLIKEGVRVELFGNGLHLGLHPFNELYCFKKDIWSHENLGFLEGHKAHLLHPDRPRLLEKMSEKDNRYDSLYLPRSSGRLMDSGKHKSGHDKPDSINSAQETNETIIEGYRKEQYQCVLIEVPCRLDSLYEELQAKFRLEGELSIPELPLVFYEPNSGSIREIVYLSDLGINQELLKGMPGNLEKLNSFAERSVSPQLGRVLFMLPPSRLLEFLIYPNVDLARAVKELSTSYRNRLPDFVQKGDLASVQWCHERGADLTSTYCSQGEYCNLLELLLEARCVERHASYTHKKAPQKLKEQTRLGMLLYDQGCRVPVNFNLLQRLPSLAIYMLGKGEPYIKGALDNPLGTLAEQLYEGVISRDEFNQAITWLQQTYADQPGQLSLFFTNHLASQLKIQETMRFKPVDLGTECGSSVKEKILLEADALLAQGIPVNTGILQQYLTTYYEQEIKSLHCHADLDKKVFEKIVQETLEAQKHQNHKSYQENPQCQKCQKYKKYQDSQATLKEYLSKLDNDVIDQLNSGGARHNYFWNERLYFASRHPTSTEQPEREREERDASRKKQIDKLADQLVNSRDTYYYSSDDKLRSLVHDARDNRCPPKYSPATEINSRTELLKKEYRKIPTLISSEKIDTARSEAEELISKQVEQKSNQVKALCKALEDLLNTLEGMAESKPAQKHLPDTEKPTPEKYDAPAPQPKADSGPAFTWLRDLFRYTPDTYNKSYCELTRLAIRHYYQTPHPDQLEWLSQQKTEIGSLRADHGVDHVIRTQILAEALLELFYQHDPDYEELLNTMPELRELIPLALVYHDVVAEVEPKSVEEARAAEFFERDIKASGRYSEELITLVSSALRNKNTNTMRRVTDPFVSDTGCSDRERQVRRLLRLPDSIDIIRGSMFPKTGKRPATPPASIRFLTQV